MADRGAVTDPPVLCQLRFSHYNEKARWALDYKGVRHVRRSSLPGLHAIRARRMTGEPTFPILVDGGRVIRDSAAIIDHLESSQPGPSLYPADPAGRERALAIQRHFDDEVGAHLRRVYFYWMLKDEPRAVSDSYTRRASAPARAAYTAAFPLTKAAMRKAMNVTPEGAERSLEASHAGVDRLEEELGDGDYLVGDSFTVADLTVAALFFPIVRPPEFQYDYPERWSPGFEEIRAGYVDRPGFAWVQEMWRRHRGASAEIAAS